MPNFLQTYKLKDSCVNKTCILRELLDSGEMIRVIGVHNGLSAKIAEKIGFDAVWASSFEISASFGLPDASLISLDKYVEVIRDISNSIRIPVIVDCDSGFGSPINPMKMAYDMEQAGVAGVCIEDNLFPKKCSFYDGKRELASAEEHSKRIRSIKKIVKDKDFVVLARTEAFIAGWDEDEALERCKRYVAAGADAILVHSKQKTPDQIFSFAKHWDSEVPLVCVPTTYNTVDDKTLFGHGYQIIIFANHSIRSSIKAMNVQLAKLLKTGCACHIDADIESLSGVFDLIDQKIFSELEDTI